MIHRFADCELDEASLSLTRKDQIVPVEPMVFDLILLLVKNAGELVTRDQLIETVWQGRIVSDSAISAGIAAARKAVGDDGKRQDVIRTVQRRGLILVPAVHRDAPGTASPNPVPEAPPSVRFAHATTGEALAYAVSGSGTPVVRSYPGSHIEMEWQVRRDRAVFDLIMQRNSLVRFDYVGVGLSEPLSSTPDFANSAEDIGVIADAAGLDDFVLYSESGGVHAALRFAAKYPDRVRRLAIIGGYVEGRSRRTDNPDFIRGMIEENWGDANSGYARAFAFSYYPEGPNDEVSEHAAMTTSALNKSSSLFYRDAINSVSNADILDQVKCPVLLVHAKRDVVHPLDQARKLAAGLRDAELCVLDSANHLPFPGHPSWSTFSSRFRDFIDDAG